MSERRYDNMDELDLGALRVADSPRAGIWWCGDDYCDCTQAVIDAREVRGTDPSFKSWGHFWNGHFYTDGEAGAFLDLQLVYDYLGARAPEVRERISWPDDFIAANSEEGHG